MPVLKNATSMAIYAGMAGDQFKLPTEFCQYFVRCQKKGVKFELLRLENAEITKKDFPQFIRLVREGFFEFLRIDSGYFTGKQLRCPPLSHLLFLFPQIM